MPMDDTDKGLLKGLGAFCFLLLVVYYYPFESPVKGYQSLAVELQDQTDSLALNEKPYNRIHPRTVKDIWGPDAVGIKEGGKGKGAIEAKDRKLMSVLTREYQDKVDELKKKIAKKQAISKVDFAKWTKVPKNYLRNPGFYFTKKFGEVRDQVRVQLRRANIDNLDPDIGFNYTGIFKTFTVEFSEMRLRQLFIAQKVIQLCVDAQQTQFADESKKHKPEAFMKILRVVPETPAPTGPFALVKNKKYQPNETNPRSEHYQKYNVKKWPNFIMEYPVEILLQCDVNSFMRFLYSVRTKGQFLVIRNLQIISPGLADTKMDKVELEKILGTSGEEDLKYENHHIWVRMSAAGMDFDPKLIKRYSSKEDKRKDKRDKNERKRGPRPTRPSGR